jgi:hypothetical protein
MDQVRSQTWRMVQTTRNARLADLSSSNAAGGEASADPIADKIALQPLRQRVLAAWRGEPIGDQYKRPLKHSTSPRELIKRAVEPSSCHSARAGQHRPPIPRAKCIDILALDAVRSVWWSESAVLVDAS